MAAAERNDPVAARARMTTREKIGLTLMVAVMLLTRLPYLGHPAPDYDEQLYSLIGQRVLHGALPYVDLWDRKPIGLFLLYALAHALGGDGPLAYQLLALLFCLVGGLLVWRIGLYLTDRGTAALASGLYPLLMAVYGSQTGQSEIFFMPAIMAMALLVLRAAHCRQERNALRFTYGAMALGGLALQIKYTALCQCLYFGIGALGVLRRRELSLTRLARQAAVFALLGVLPTALAALFYFGQGKWPDFLFANLLSIGRRGAMPAALTWKAQAIFALPLIVLAAGGLVYALRAMPRAPGWWFAPGWLAAALAGLFMGSTIYPYYYAALVPAVILTALPMFERRRPLGTVTLAAALGGLLLVFNPPAHFAAARRERASLAEMVHQLSPQVTRDHRLFVYDGPVALYRLTGSCLPTRFIYPDHLNNLLEAHALPVDPTAEVARILAHRPGAIVTTRDAVTLRNPGTDRLLGQELQRNYSLLTSIDFQDRRIDLYARRNAADPVTKSADHR
jgi:4-amino-4-deoxy-L-arabinose transferase-like glycosyltransferase